MKRAEISRKFDEIVAFAGVEQFIDTPVKRYSSGMGLRLGFAVAAHLEPEILVVDEVLAVGDAEFQKKCLGKMSQVAGQGRTILFVSHNMAAVKSLCNRALWLHQGTVMESGNTDTVITSYLGSTLSTLTEQKYEDLKQAPGNDRIRVHRMRVLPAEGDPSAPITMTTPVRLEFEYWNLRPNTRLNLSLHIYNQDNIMAFNTAPVHDTEWMGQPYSAGLFRSTCIIPAYLLNSGAYRVDVLFVENSSYILYEVKSALVFDVEEAPETRGLSTWYGRWPGILHPRLEWETANLDILEIRE
ncbi:MAG: ABC transporter ATP-binding protein [Chloroflexi bacterium]|uniref:ABC transporter ATP-binding protein n=1 Tax=Candidatus Flexifilum breve TaxID=3140694 RepID=UPI0031362545|nr:ABC transporter ATP-binding protein [Chloroflexota bacterium]